MMKVDLRQVVAGFLTFTMFAMLGDMIKREYRESLQTELREEKHERVPLLSNLSDFGEGPWKKADRRMKQCWDKPGPDPVVKSTGFITFSLTGGPEYHVHQIADAVAVARYLHATLVVPEIRGRNTGDERKFEEMYDVKKFVKSLDGVVKGVKSDDGGARNAGVVKVPSGIGDEYTAEHIESVFHERGSVRLATYFPAPNARIGKRKAEAMECVSMYGTLSLQPAIREVVDLMIGQLRSFAGNSGGRFVAVDLSCRDGNGECYSPRRTALFLRGIGFDEETVLYSTRPDRALLDFFRNVHTKQSLMLRLTGVNQEKERLLSYDEAVDYYICSESDVFVPSDASGMFYSTVAGNRIASGRDQILVPSNVRASSSSHFLSSYISQKNHFAHSCFC